MSTAIATTPGAPAKPVGLSQSALVWKQFRKRKLAVASGAMIICLVVLSVFAPLLANDRPLWYVGVNRSDYQESLRNLRSLLDKLAKLPGPESQEWPGTVTAIRFQQKLMLAGLTDEPRAAFAGWSQKLEPLLTSSVLDKEKLQALRGELRAQFAADKVKLITRTYFPVIAGLSGLDLFFMTLVLLALPAPLWFRFLPASSRGSALRGLLLWGVPMVVGMGWWWLVPVRLDRTPYKQGVLASDPTAATAPVVFAAVTWPPVPFSLDEGHLDHIHVPPAWYPADHKANARLDTAPKSPWDGKHWLGTDGSGRDLLSRMLWGGRVSLSVGIVAVSIYVAIGIIVGALAGYFRGWVDLLISRIIEVVICFPAFFLILTIVSFLKPSIWNIMIVIGVTGWTGVARLIRGEFLRLVDQEFVLAGRALGYSAPRLIFRHILPNALAPVLVTATFGIAGAILTESALSFLGFGISVPTPSWGSILSSGREALNTAPWLIQIPGFAIFLTITAYNLVGETIRDAADPRLRGVLK